MKTLNYNKKNYAEHELELSAHSYEQDFQSWISPYYRLACNEISSLKTAETNNSGHMGLYAYGLFQGISVEVIRNVSVQGVGLSATPSRNFLLAATPKLCYADLL